MDKGSNWKNRVFASVDWLGLASGFLKFDKFDEKEFSRHSSRSPNRLSQKGRRKRARWKNS